ncbi:MAG: transporter [Burkholderiales bacterium]|nr:transporter [Burkholderiales bacterium]
MKLKRKAISIYPSVICLLAASYSSAQSTPSEFAEMSLQELFNTNIYERNGLQNEFSAWTLTYQYKTAEFEGYLDGTKSLSFEDVKGPPSDGSGKTFPVVPTRITQTAHIYGVGYQFNERWQGHLSVPYILQETDHLSLVPGYETFIIKTDGIGDAVISASYNFNSPSWLLSIGLSFPTGSIDEVGDTPREAGNQQVPYTMQLGSGTYDLPVELSYQSSARPNFNLNVSATIRTGTNDRDYRLGNHYSVKARYKFDLSERWKSYAGLTFHYRDSINGQDDSLLLGEPPTIYPASITNPNLYGGEKISGRVGFLWKISDEYRLNAEFGKPIYQSLNGPQPKEQWRSALSISKSY